MTKITANNPIVKRLARLAQLGADIEAAKARGAKIEEHDGSVIAVEKDGKKSCLYRESKKEKAVQTAEDRGAKVELLDCGQWKITEKDGKVWYPQNETKSQKTSILAKRKKSGVTYF